MNADSVSDRLNPVLVKEIRQGLKSRAFNFSFMLMQGLMVVSMIIQLLSIGQNFGREAASTMFWVFAGGPLLILLPLLSVNAIYGEHRQQTLPLVLLTNLTPWRMVCGKWASLMAQAMLIACAVLPYAVLRYFLGGINLAMDLLTLALIVSGCALLCAGGILLSTVKYPWRALWIGVAIFIVFSPLTIGIIGLLVFFFFAMAARPDLVPLQMLFASGALLHWAAGRYANYRFHERVESRIYSFMLLIAVVGCLQAAGKFPPAIIALPVLLPPLLYNLLAAAKLARPEMNPRRRTKIVFASVLAALLLCLLTQKLPGPGRLYFFATFITAIALPAYVVRILRRWLTPFVPMLVFVELMLLLIGGVPFALCTNEFKSIPGVLQVVPISSFIITACDKADPAYQNINLVIAALALLALARAALASRRDAGKDFAHATVA